MEIMRYSFKEYAKLVEQTTEEVKEQLDFFDDGTEIKIVYLVRKGEDESCYTGLKYTDGRYAIVGVRIDKEVSTEEELIKLMETGLGGGMEIEIIKHEEHPRGIRLMVEQLHDGGRKYFIETPYAIEKGVIDWEEIFDREFGVYLSSDLAKIINEEEEEEIEEGYYMVLLDRGTNYTRMDNESQMLDRLLTTMKSIIARDPK